MSNLRNNVQLIGNVGNKPETTTFESGKKICRFSLATNEYYLKDGEKQQQTSWHNLVAWGKQAEIFEAFVDKGKEIAISGKLASRSYESESGDKKFITEVIVNEVLFLNGNNN